MNTQIRTSALSGWSALKALAALSLLTLMLSGCPKSYPDCSKDKDCAAHGEVCVQERCRQCRDNSQCAKLDACMTCQANECVKRPGCCKSDLDCPNGRCAGGSCVAQQTCNVNSDCPDDQNCVAGICVNRTGCTADSECPAGLKCRDGACTTACTIEAIHFDFNEYAIPLAQERVLQANVKCLRESPVRSVRVEGHADERGADEYNLTLAQRRANSVARQYKALGVTGLGRSLSWGEEKPVCTGSNESCWRQNRRVETTVQ